MIDGEPRRDARCADARECHAQLNGCRPYDGIAHHGLLGEVDAAAYRGLCAGRAAFDQRHVLILPAQLIRAIRSRHGRRYAVPPALRASLEQRFQLNEHSLSAVQLFDERAARDLGYSMNTRPVSTFWRTVSRTLLLPVSAIVWPADRHHDRIQSPLRRIGTSISMVEPRADRYAMRPSGCHARHGVLHLGGCRRKAWPMISRALGVDWLLERAAYLVLRSPPTPSWNHRVHVSCVHVRRRWSRVHRHGAPERLSRRDHHGTCSQFHPAGHHGDGYSFGTAMGGAVLLETVFSTRVWVLMSSVRARDTQYRGVSS